MNTHIRTITACMLCIVIVAMLLPVVALGDGFCSYRDPNTDIACGKQTRRRIVYTSDVQKGWHTYDSELGTDALCDYFYYYITEADVCSAGHTTNPYTYTYEYDHACQNAGR